MNHEFWNMLDHLVQQSEIIIDRPKGSAHPKFSHLIYPVDYGYLKHTTSMDGDGIDIFVGQIDAAGKGHLAIDDGDFAVISIILVRRKQRDHRAKDFGLNSLFP